MNRFCLLKPQIGDCRQVCFLSNRYSGEIIRCKKNSRSKSMRVYSFHENWIVYTQALCYYLRRKSDTFPRSMPISFRNTDENLQESDRLGKFQFFICSSQTFHCTQNKKHPKTLNASQRATRVFTNRRTIKPTARKILILELNIVSMRTWTSNSKWMMVVGFVLPFTF